MGMVHKSLSCHDVYREVTINYKVESNRLEEFPLFRMGMSILYRVGMAVKLSLTPAFTVLQGFIELSPPEIN